QDERAVAGHDAERGVALGPAAGDQHRLVRSGHLITEHCWTPCSFAVVYQGISAVNSDPARSFHGSTTTVRGPRTSTTSTLLPFGNGSSDHARKASCDPRRFTSTSPAP